MGNQLPPAYIIDVDGTLTTGPKDRGPFEWDKVHQDEPNHDVVRAVQALSGDSYVDPYLIVVTGRSDACRFATEEWLEDHLQLWDVLHMRKDGDYRPDYVVKAEIYEQHIKGRYRVIGVFEDRKSVVDYWRSQGLTVFHVAEGNF